MSSPGVDKGGSLLEHSITVAYSGPLTRSSTLRRTTRPLSCLVDQSPLPAQLSLQSFQCCPHLIHLVLQLRVLFPQLRIRTREL